MTSLYLQNQSLLSESYPITFLSKLSKMKQDGCLEVIYGNITYWIYFKQGHLIYATNSVKPFERLERHLRYFSNTIPALNGDLRTQVRIQFEPDNEIENSECYDYQGVLWLVENKYISTHKGADIIKSLTKEVLETYLLIPKITSKSFLETSIFEKFSPLSHLDTQPLIDNCIKRIEQWQFFHPHVWSSYQRPYFVGTASNKNQLNIKQKKKLAALLKGFSFRQLGALLHQDEINLIKRFYPLIKDGSILLRDPQSPFDKFPKITANNAIEKKKKSSIKKAKTQKSIESNEEKLSITDLSSKLSKKTYKVACIDDSPVMLKEFNRFLDDQSLETFLINDSTKALIGLMRIKPDLILLDIGMPNIDGYQLCAMLRKNRYFKNIPIVMVTGNTGIINRAKAKFSGATDYLTKPFTQSQLLQIVFRYLS